MQPGKVYLIPTVLFEASLETIPAYILGAVQACDAFFVENEKTARRFLKKMWKEMVIDDYHWVTIHKAEQAVINQFLDYLHSGKNIGILSEAGCPGIADPGQILVQAAQQEKIVIKPFVGPSSILLALMASGMNGQCFQFNGYLPIDAGERRKKIKALEIDSQKNNCTHIFIETPYRNNALLHDLLQTCQQNTRVCVAVDITSPNETIITRSVIEWKVINTDIHKHLAIFLLQA